MKIDVFLIFYIFYILSQYADNIRSCSSSRSHELLTLKYEQTCVYLVKNVFGSVVSKALFYILHMESIKGPCLVQYYLCYRLPFFWLGFAYHYPKLSSEAPAYVIISNNM